MASASSNPDPNSLYGLTALPAAASLLKPRTTTPTTVPVSTLNAPTTALATRIDTYAREHLPAPTYAHSRRVYAYGLAIARECFPNWDVTPGSALEETWFMTAMLHDIGTADAVIETTKLSYEFWAGVEALRLLQHPNQSEDGVAPKEQAESVAEAIFRHQDVQDKGQISLVTMLIQLGTLLDNVGAERRLVSQGTVDEVNAKWGREGWSGCFRGTVEREKSLKPWAMVSRIEGFEGKISENNITGDGKGN